MSVADGVFYDLLYPLVRKINSEFKKIYEIIENKDRVCAALWNNLSERDQVFYQSAQALRGQAADIAEIVQSNTKNTSMKIFSLFLPENPLENLFKILKRTSAEIFIIVEELTGSAAQILLNTLTMDYKKFTTMETKFNSQLNEILRVLSRLRDELDGIEYDKAVMEDNSTVNYSVPAYSSPAKNQRASKSLIPEEMPDIDNILMEFESAVSDLQPIMTNLNPSSNTGPPIAVHSPQNRSGSMRQPRGARGTGSPNRGQGPPHRGGPPGNNPRGGPNQRAQRGIPSLRGDGRSRPTSNPNMNQLLSQNTSAEEINIDDVVSAFEDAVKVTNNFNSTNNQNNMPGPQRPSSVNPQKPLVRKGTDFTTRSTNFAPQNNAPSPNNINSESKRALSEMGPVVEELAVELQNLLLSTNIDQLEGCQTAIKFAPTAKSLLLKTTEFEQVLKKSNAHAQADALHELLLKYIHSCKDVFLQEIKQSDRLTIETNKREFISFLHASIAGSAVPAFVPVKPTQAAQDLTSMDRSNRSMTMFSAGAVPKRKPTFSAQIGQVKATPEPEPPKQGLTKAQHRERAVQEIFDSEKTYLVVLQRIIWIYKKPLSETQKDSIISEKEIRDIFSNIEMIFEFNKKLIKELERVRSANESTVGQVFLDNAPMMKIYSHFINNYDLSTQTLMNCKSRSAFRALLDNYNTVAGGNMDLSAYLIQPIQRLPRYEMLVNAVVKLTEDDHPEKESLVLAAKKIKEIVDEVNESKRKAEKRDAVYQIQTRLEEKPANLIIVVPNRNIVHSAIVQRVEHFKSKKTEKRIVHLFNDAFLISKIRGSGASFTYKFKAFYTPSSDFNVETYDLPNSLIITQTQENEIGETTSSEEIWVCDSESDRDTWITHLSTFVVPS